MRIILLFLLNCIFVLTLIGCADQAPTNGAQAPAAQVVQPSTNIPTPVAGKSVVTGRAVSNTNQAPIKKTYVYLAKVYWDDAHKNAAFAVDQARGPVGQTDDNGFFSINAVDPFEYVVVIGDIYGANEPIREQNGDARIYKIEAGKTLDLGVVQVSPNVKSS